MRRLPSLARIARWFDPRGRLSRKVFVRRAIRLMWASAALLCAAITLGAQGWRLGAFAVGSGIAALWLISFIQTIRRLHDRGRTGWWLVLGLGLALLSEVPVEAQAEAHPVAVVVFALAILIGSSWFLIETLGRRGVVGPNRYGPEPADR